MIELASVSRNFGKTAALKDVSVKIPDGSFFIVVGPNGAGKTTMLRIMSGELLPTSGTVTVDNVRDFKTRIAVAEENRDFFNEFNAFKYSELYKFLYDSFDGKRFFELIKRLDIEPGKPVESFSKGMKTWLMNSLVISTNAPVMILDEPLQHLDPSVRMDFHALLREENAKGRTLIISTHEISEFSDAAKSLGIINHGRIIYSGDIDQTVFSHRMVPGTMSFDEASTVGPVFNEKLVRTNDNTGREPLLKEIIAAYINGSDLSERH